jgi:sugar O-acyltransferase (sialic acid O-acetyltransferase NeuD family)
MIISEILVPLLNANEPEARLARIQVKDGDHVSKGQILFTLETTKAAADIESPGDGFIHIQAKEDDIYPVGQRIAVLTEHLDDKVFQETVAGSSAEPEKMSVPANLRITNPARALAESLAIDLTKLPTDRLVTETVVRQYARPQEMQISLPASEKPLLVMYGAGGHSKTIIEMIRQLDEFTIAGIVDDNPALTGTRMWDHPVFGTRVVLSKLRSQGVELAVNGVGSILDINVRVRIFERLEQAGFRFPSLVHPRATIEASARVDEGVQVFAGAYVGSETILNSRCMINTNAVVSHECEVGAYTHIAPGALLAGLVKVGSRTLIGMGVTTAIGIKIGSGVRVGNGANLLADVPDNTIIQAGRFWTGRAESLK